MDAEDVIEADAFDALNVAAVTDLAAVFQHVPEDTNPPVLIIGDMDSEPIVTKGGSDQRVALTIAAVVLAEERRPLRALKAVVLAALDGRQVSRDGWQLAYNFTGADGFLDPETGEAYAGNFRFSVMALKE